MKRNKIIVITCGSFERDTMKHVIKAISGVIPLTIDRMECTMDISKFYNPARRQYNADLLLEELQKRAPRGYMKYLCLFRVDLFIPILTYIFGQAQLNGSFGIASLYRLRNELYGLKEDNALMKDRFSTVAIHELGHTFGLIHCTNPVCVMRSSTYVEDLDQKAHTLCTSCQEKLESGLKGGHK